MDDTKGLMDPRPAIATPETHEAAERLIAELDRGRASAHEGTYSLEDARSHLAKRMRHHAA